MNEKKAHMCVSRITKKHHVHVFRGVTKQEGWHLLSPPQALIGHPRLVLLIPAKAVLQRLHRALRGCECLGLPGAPAAHILEAAFLADVVVLLLAFQAPEATAPLAAARHEQR